MSYRVRNQLELEVVETFVEKLERSDEISIETKDIILDSLERTSISQQSTANEIAELLIEAENNASE